MNGRITSFKDLVAWQKGHNLVLQLYKVTSRFPTTEQFGLSNQLRRAGVSITSNISEGFYRRTAVDKNSFYTVSLGSLGEVWNQITIANDLGYISQAQYEELEIQISEVMRILRALMQTAQTKK
ncbi:four helix bundle protein [Candidatus Woesebacteria bacterium]|nr:four helix bundle protein [Candidatus Woesebacteria bacterium]